MLLVSGAENSFATLSARSRHRTFLARPKTRARNRRPKLLSKKILTARIARKAVCTVQQSPA
jgi:hypothetical protein